MLTVTAARTHRASGVEAGNIAAIATATSAVLIAVGGWWANRRLRLPSNVQTLIRQETSNYVTALEQKVARLEHDLATERSEREAEALSCGQRIEALVEGIVERDLVIASLHKRLRLPEPHVSDPRA